MDNSTIKNNHNINITDRNLLFVTGIIKIENFDDEEFEMVTNMGNLTVKGNELELVKLDTSQGNISIKGNINSLEYSQNNKIKNSSGLFNKLFK